MTLATSLPKDAVAESGAMAGRAEQNSRGHPKAERQNSVTKQDIKREDRGFSRESLLSLERHRDAGAHGGAASPLRRDLACRLARDIASAVLDVPMEEIARSNRSVASTSQARHVAMYLAHVTLQVPLRGVASEFGRDRTSVSYAIARIEDLRDAPKFDALIARLERLALACRHFAGEGVGEEMRGHECPRRGGVDA